MNARFVFFAAPEDNPRKDHPKRDATYTLRLRTCYAANVRPNAFMKDQLVEMTPRVIQVWMQEHDTNDPHQSDPTASPRQGEPETHGILLDTRCYGAPVAPPPRQGVPSYNTIDASQLSINSDLRATRAPDSISQN